MKRHFLLHLHIIKLISNIPTNVLLVTRFYFILIKFLVESQEGPTMYSEQLECWQLILLSVLSREFIFIKCM